VAEIKNDPRVTLYYAHPEHHGYVTVYGTAKLVDSEEEKDKRWKEEYANYFPEGKAGYILIAVKPQKIEITDYPRGIMGDQKTWQPPAIEF
jgi:general stress protein 26